MEPCSIASKPEVVQYSLGQLDKVLVLVNECGPFPRDALFCGGEKSCKGPAKRETLPNIVSAS